MWSSLYCGFSSLCVGLYRWLVKVSWLGKLVSVFWRVELYFFSLLSKSWFDFLGAWCPLPAFRSCFVGFTQRLNALLMNLWGRKCSPRPTPPPSWLLPSAALFSIARTWKKPRYPSTDKWIKKLWYICTMQYYSSIKRNTFESVLMRSINLEPIIQSEGSQKEKDKYRILKTRDLFKKIRDTKQTFHAKMGLIKDRNGMDLTEAEDIKRWQEYTKNCTKKIFTTQIITMVWSLT